MTNNNSYKVLVVDDNNVTRDLICSVLASKGHKCVTATNGREALELFSKTNFDAVITDIIMPLLDGLKMTRELIEGGCEAPIMVMTGFPHENSYDDAVAAGAEDFIVKPFSVDEFLARFHRMMRDAGTLCQIRMREKEIEVIGQQMIEGVQKDATERIALLNKEIEELRLKPSR